MQTPLIPRDRVPNIPTIHWNDRHKYVPDDGGNQALRFIRRVIRINNADGVVMLVNRHITSHRFGHIMYMVYGPLCTHKVPPRGLISVDPGSGTGSYCVEAIIPKENLP